MELPLRFIPFQVAARAVEAPEGDTWQHEIKYDGYRTQIILDGSEALAFTRNGHDWTERYQPIVRASRGLRCDRAILDGEVIVQDARGHSDFGALPLAIRTRPRDLVFMAFDLLHLGDTNLTGSPLVERRERLLDLIGPTDPAQCIQFSAHTVGRGKAVFEAAERMGLEGIVSKKRASRYRSGPSRAWLKIKAFTTDEFVVIGIEQDIGPSVALLARDVRGHWEYAGSVMLALAGADRDRFWRAINRLKTDHAPIIMKTPRKRVQWIKPELAVTARYLRGEGKLRHATIIGLS